jgi:DNA-binding SARP family transcriptional activator
LAGPQIRVLGPVEVDGVDSTPAALVGARQRAILAGLALQPGQVVSQWRLAEMLWGDQPPRTAAKSLHSHIARIRAALDGCGRPELLVTREPGYLLAVDASGVDAGCFEQQVDAARQDLAGSRFERAFARLQEGLALWRGDALADAQPCGWGAAEADRLNDARVAAREHLCEALLGLGRHDAAAAELERLVAADPLRERVVGLQMRALCAAGRQADAVSAYQRLRGQLADKLGIDAGPQLQQLYTSILRGECDGARSREEAHG